MFGSENTEPAEEPVKIEEVVEEKPQTDLDHMDRCGRLRFEYEMEQTNPKHEALRLTGEPTMKFVDFLRFMGLSIPVDQLVSAYVVDDDWTGKRCQPIEDLTGYGLWDDILTQEQNGRWMPKAEGKNVMVHLNYRVGEGKGYVMVHLAPWGEADETTHQYLRATVMHRAAQGGTMSGGRCLCCFDEGDAQPVVELYREKLASAQEKLRNRQEPDEEEAAALDYVPMGQFGTWGLEAAQV